MAVAFFLIVKWILLLSIAINMNDPIVLSNDPSMSMNELRATFLTLKEFLTSRATSWIPFYKIKYTGRTS